MDIKQTIATAHILHSQAVRAGAPVELLQAFDDWINRLSEQKAGAHVDRVSVSDMAEVGVINVRDKN